MTSEEFARFVEAETQRREEAEEAADAAEEAEKMVGRRLRLVAKALNQHAHHLVTTAQDAGFSGFALRWDGDYWFSAKFNDEYRLPGQIFIQCLRESAVLMLDEEGWTLNGAQMGPDTAETLEHIKLNMRLLCAFAIEKPAGPYGGPSFKPIPRPSQEAAQNV